MAMMWRRHRDEAELVTGSSMRVTCPVDMVKTGARLDERCSFELWRQAGSFVRPVLKAFDKPTERRVDTNGFDAVLDGESLVAANKLLPGGLVPRAYVFKDQDGQQSGVLKVAKFAAFNSLAVGIPTVATVKVKGEVVLAVDPLVRFDLASPDDTRDWLAYEVADFCDTAVLRATAVGGEGESWLGLLRGEPETVDELLDEQTSDDRRRELVPTSVPDSHSIDTVEGRESMRQMWSVVRVFGADGVAALAELQARLSHVDPESLQRTTLELAGRELAAGDATDLHLDEEQRLGFALLAPLDAGGSTAVAIRATLIGDGPDDVLLGSTVIAPPLVITVDGERVTVDIGEDEPITVHRGGMGPARLLATT